MRSAILPMLAISATAALIGCANDPTVNRNEAPVADVGDDISQAANMRVFLDGRSSYDADGDEMEFYWTIDHAPEGSNRAELADPFSPNRSGDAATTTFQPDAQGVYVIELVTYDGRLYSDPAYIVVDATEPTDSPIANAGNDQTMAFPATANLDGGQSQDPLGGLLTFEWFLVSKPYNSSLGRNSITNPTVQNPSFTPDVSGTYTIGLIVCNPQGCSEEAGEVTLNFTGDNVAPVANAGGDFEAEDCRDVPLNCGASSDADGDLLFHWWQVQAVPDGSEVDNRFITNQNAAEPDIFFDIAGEYQLSCSVFDGQAWSRPDVITVDVAERSVNEVPDVDAGEDHFTDYGVIECTVQRVPYSWSPETTTCPKVGEDADLVTFEATVTDPDGDAFDLEWEVVRESKVRIKGRTDGLTAAVELPVFSRTELGKYEDISFLQLTATDCTGAKGKDEVEIITAVEAIRVP